MIGPYNQDLWRENVIKFFCRALHININELLVNGLILMGCCSLIVSKQFNKMSQKISDFVLQRSRIGSVKLLKEFRDKCEVNSLLQSETAIHVALLIIIRIYLAGA